MPHGRNVGLTFRFCFSVGQTGVHASSAQARVRGGLYPPAREGAEGGGGRVDRARAANGVPGKGRTGGGCRSESMKGRRVVRVWSELWTGLFSWLVHASVGLFVGWFG